MRRRKKRKNGESDEEPRLLYRRQALKELQYIAKPSRLLQTPPLAEKRRRAGGYGSRR
jgi:hypothetical protein